MVDLEHQIRLNPPQMHRACYAFSCRYGKALIQVNQQNLSLSVILLDTWYEMLYQSQTFHGRYRIKRIIVGLAITYKSFKDRAWISKDLV